MCWYEINIKPRDVLFFRDAKPMEASSIGHGSQWPWPNVLHDAFISAFHRRWPEPQEWEFKHQHKNTKDKNWDTSSMRFGGVRSIGLFPTVNGELHFPKPADISSKGDDIATLQAIEGESNLPDFLEYTLLNNGEKTKESAGDWISASEMQNYLKGGLPEKFIKSSEIYDAESRFGIAIDPKTGTADKGAEDEGGKVYIAEYMRLRENVGIKGFVTGTSSLRGDKKTDILEKFFRRGKNEHIILGGQRGIAGVDAVRIESPALLNANNYDSSLLVKWVLLTPSIFINGWKPGWIDKNGKVCLPAEKPERKKNESRTEWRSKFGKSINAKLVAARIDKPKTFSGWSLAKGGPRATKYAVPAGSIYYFRADSHEDAKALSLVLQGHCKSDYYGEKGFGFGVCTVCNLNK